MKHPQCRTPLPGPEASSSYGLALLPLAEATLNSGIEQAGGCSRARPCSKKTPAEPSGRLWLAPAAPALNRSDPSPDLPEQRPRVTRDARHCKDAE